MAAAKKGQLVPRPPKKAEYEIRFATTRGLAKKNDLLYLHQINER